MRNCQALTASYFLVIRILRSWSPRRSIEIIASHSASKRGNFSPHSSSTRLPFSAEQLIQSEGIEFTRRVDAIEIDVEEIDVRAAILVDEGKGGTGHIVLRGGLQAFGNAFDQRGLARAEIAAKNDHARALQGRSETAAERDGFFR